MWDVVDVLAEERGDPDVVATVSSAGEGCVVAVPGYPDLHSFFPRLESAIVFLEDFLPPHPG
jgi:hypothetical protein